MKSSAAVLKTRYRRNRSQATQERTRGSGPALCDYIEMLRPTAQTLDEALCLLDLAGYVQYANPSALRLLGRAEADAVGASLHTLIRCAADPQVASAWGERADLMACSLLRPDGSSVAVDCALRGVTHDGKRLATTLIISPRQRAHADGAAPDGPDGPEAKEGALERRMRILDAVGDIALAQLPLDSLLKALLDGLRHELALENIAIFLVNDDGETLSVRMASGAGAEVADRIRLPLADTLVGQALLDRRTIFVPDVELVGEQWVHFSPEIRSYMNVRSFIVAPLVVEDRLIGGLYLGASQRSHFSNDDARLAELIGERAALAIERARARDEAARAHERLRFLNDASGALTETLDYHDTTQRLAAILAPALADACAIYLLEDDGLLRKMAMQAPARGLLSANPFGPMLRRLIQRIDAMAVVNPDDTDNPIAECVRILAPVFERRPLDQSSAQLAAERDELAEALDCLCVSVPLVVRQHAVGVAHLALRSGKQLSDGDLALIRGLAERAAIAIDNARLYSETQEALATGSAMATQLDAIFNATDVGIFVTDAAGGFLRINPYGRRLLGIGDVSLEHAPANVGGMFQLRTTEGDEIPANREPLHLARTLGEPVEQRLVIHRFDTGKDIQALTSCTPWRDDRNQVAGAIGVVTNITAIHELERQKDEFLGIASHELKTPLTSLKILARLQVRKMEASGEPRDAEQAQHMQVAIIRMENLIRDLLDVSLIQEGMLPLRKERLDLGELCAAAIGEQRLVTQRVIRFSAHDGAHDGGHGDAPMPVYADRERIYQVISNLLSNALKYSPATQPVTVRARATEQECIVAVLDHGPGMPAEAQEHIFDRFYRVPGMQVQSGSGVGLGLGLHISKDIVSRHGGRLWVESKLGYGSTFSMALPRADTLATDHLPQSRDA
ncbi:MAG: ATP-binding protein [Ktedonobacterales bacterium]|jgi:PAS domain S-box-containing protein